MSSRSAPAPAPPSGGAAPSEILTPPEAAAFLRVKERQLQRLGVPALRLGHRTRRYRRADVERWLAERVEQP